MEKKCCAIQKGQAREGEANSRATQEEQKLLPLTLLVIAVPQWKCLPQWETLAQRSARVQRCCATETEAAPP
eukprot:1141398-Pelagomonas_calceolata.AAC.2